MLSLVVDSVMWQKLGMLPEWWVLHFNLIAQRSAEFGVLPFHAYFTRFLPWLVQIALPLSVLGAVIDEKARPFFAVAVANVLIFSLLGHKEERFILYAIPLFNVVAAAAMAKM